MTSIRRSASLAALIAALASATALESLAQRQSSPPAALSATGDSPQTPTDPIVAPMQRVRPPEPKLDPRLSAKPVGRPKAATAAAGVSKSKTQSGDAKGKPASASVQPAARSQATLPQPASKSVAKPVSVAPAATGVPSKPGTTAAKKPGATALPQ